MNKFEQAEKELQEADNSITQYISEESFQVLLGLLDMAIKTGKTADQAEQIIKHYGIKKQLIKFTEELGELNTEVSRMILEMEGVKAKGNLSALIEELADVMLIAQEILIYSGEGVIEFSNSMMEFKAERTLQRIEEERSRNEKNNK